MATSSTSVSTFDIRINKTRHTIGPSRAFDTISAFILGKKTIGDLTTFTSACNPDISSEPSAEPITIAAEQALQKMKMA